MSVTTNLQLSTPAHGAQVDTWDQDPINGNSGILDNAFGGVTSLSLSASGTTLNTTASQYAVLRFSGVLTANVTVTLGAIVKTWTVLNLCTGTGTLTLSTGTGQVLGLPPGAPVDVFSDGANLRFKNMGNIAQEETWAVGSMPAWVSACTVPPYLLEDGSTFSSTVYPALFLLTGTTTLADARGRVRANVNGTSARITTAASGIDGDTKLSAGGSQTATLDTTMIPAHSHGVTDPGHTHTPSGGGSFLRTTGTGSPNLTTGGGAYGAGALTGNSTTGISIDNTGGGLPHNNMQPTFIGGITVIRAA